MQNNRPTVSVIIPTYNRGNVITRALQSVLNQTYREIEVIVVDDASTDDTELVIHSFCDKRIKYLRHTRTQGAAAARNSGIQAASSEYIAFQDSDDEWLCEKLERQMEVFCHSSPEVGLIFCGFLRVKEKNAVYLPQLHVTPDENILRMLLRGNFISTQTVVIRKACFEKAGLFDEKLPRFQDWELFIRIAKHYRFDCIDQALVVIFHSADSITANDQLLPIALNILLQKHHDEFSMEKKKLAGIYYSFGSRICASNNLTDGAIFLKKSLTLNPYRINCWLRLLAVFAGYRTYRFLEKIATRFSRIVD